MNYIDNIILRNITNNASAYIAAGFVPMWYDDYITDNFITLIANMLPFFIVISYAIPVCRMISLIVQEKEYKNKEMMMIMGLSNFAYWTSWITYYFSIYTVIAGINSLICMALFNYSSTGLIFLMFWLYGISCIAFSVLMSMLFSKSRTAVMLSLMLFFISYFISFAVMDPILSFGQKAAASLLPNVALYLGIDILAKLEEGRSGVQNSININTKKPFTSTMESPSSEAFIFLALKGPQATGLAFLAIIVCFRATLQTSRLTDELISLT